MRRKTMETNLNETNVTENSAVSPEATNAAKKDFSKIGLFLLLGTLIIFAVQMGAVAISENVPAIANSEDLSFICSMLPMYVIAMPIIFLIFKKIPVTITGEKKQMKPIHILAAFAIGYAGTYACNLVGTLITTVVGILKGGQVDNVVLNLTSSISPLTTLVVVAVCAPIMEELMFRKMLIDRTYKYGEGMSIVFSGLVFGLFHGNLNQFAYAFFLGIFFGFIYVKTKNIVYPIILHMITNFIGSFVGTFILEKSRYLEFATKLTEVTADPTTMDPNAMMNLFGEYAGGILLFFGYAMCLFAVVITGLIIFLVNKKKFTLAPGVVTIEKGKRFSTMVLNVGVILYSIFWIVNIVMQLFQ